MTQPTNVGSAWVVLRATSDKVRDDIKNAMQKAWKDNEKDALAAGRRAGQRYGRGFKAGLESQRVDKALTDILAGHEREAGLAGARAGRRFADNYNREVSRNTGTVPGSAGGNNSSSGTTQPSFNMADIDRANRERERQAEQSAARQQALQRAIDAANARRDQAAARAEAQRQSNIQRFQRQAEQANTNRDEGEASTRRERVVKIRTVLNDKATLVLRTALSAIMGMLKGIAVLSAGAITALAGQAAIAGLAGILGSLTQIAGVLAALPALAVAFAVPLAAAVIGANGLGAAFKAMKAQTEDAANTSKAVATAQKQVVSAEEALEDAIDGVARAEKNAESAARAHERARDNVAKAIKTVTERLQDMNLELKGTALDEEDALIAVARAEENLRNMPAGSTALDRREAINDLKKAQLALESTRESNEDTRQEAAQMYKEGVEGSEEVRDARQAEADAADNVAEANKAIADAQKNVVKAQESLAEAIRGVSEAANSSSVEKFQKAMAKLAPSAQDFVTKMQALGPQWTNLRKAVQQNLFSGLGDDVTQLANKQLPILQDALSWTSTTLNGIAKDVIGSFSSGQSLDQWQAILVRVNKALEIARPGILALVNGFKNLVTVGSRFLERFAKAFTENAQQFEKWTSNFSHIEKLINSGLKALSMWWTVIKNIGGALHSIFSAGAETGFMQSLVDVTTEMNVFLKSTEGNTALKEFFARGTEAMRLVAPVLKEIVLIILDVGAKLAGLGAAIAPGVLDFLRGFREGIERLQPAIDVLGPKISALFSSLGGQMPLLGDTVSSLVIAFAPWLDVMRILTETLLPVVLNLLILLSPTLSALAPVIVGLAIAWKVYNAALAVQTALQKTSLGQWILAKIAMVAHAAWAGIVTAATWAWGKAQAALNLIMAGNPVALVVLAIAALVAAFILAYKNSETFREKVQLAWEGIKIAASFVWENVLKPIFNWIIAGWTRVAQIFMDYFNNVIKPAWNLLTEVISWAWNNIISPLFNYIVAGWKLVAEGFGWYWENVIRPAWDLLTAGISWFWDNILSPIFNYIGAGWKLVAEGFGWYWENVISPAWGLLTAGIGWFWDNILKPIFGYISAGWQLVAEGFGWWWENIVKPAWNALTAALQWGWDNIISPVWENFKKGLEVLGVAFTWMWENVIKPAWDALGSGIRWVYDNVIKKVFDGFGEALDWLYDYFDTKVKSIGAVWDGLKDLMKKPLKFVIDTVYNGGIRKAWNAVAGLIGGNELPEMKVEGLKSGGVVDGRKLPFQDQTYGVMSGYSPGRDDRLIAVGGGEPVLRPEAGRVLGTKWVNGINAAARSGGTSGVKSFMREAYADGGVVESMRRFVATNSPGMALTSGLRYTDNGYHSKGMAADFSDGSDTTPGMQRLANLIANTFAPPKTLQLIHQPFNRNIGQGAGFVGDGLGFYGAGTMSEHRNHVHWASDGPVDDKPGDDKSVFGDIVDGIVGLGRRGLAAMFDAAIAPAELALQGLSKAMDGNESDFAKMPMGVFSKAKSALRDYIVSKDGDSSNVLGAGALTPTPGTGPVQDQVREAMIPYGWNQGPEWDALVQLVQGESSWNPNARNPSSGAYGLFQFLGTTKDAYLPDENPNPRIQGAAGARYIKDRYGSPTGAWSFWNAQNPHWYDNGGWLKKGLTLANNETDGPEAVLTNQQWDWVRQGLNFDGANKWASEQDFAGQFSQIGIDAVKETLGGFTDLVGLKSVSDDLIDQAVSAVKEEITKMQSQSTTTVVEPNKMADTMIFNVTDEQKIVEELQRASEQSMTPSNGRYRGAN